MLSPIAQYVGDILSDDIDHVVHLLSGSDISFVSQIDACNCNVRVWLTQMLISGK